MSIEIKCDADAFEGFSSGLYRAIIVEGKTRHWEYGATVKKGDAVVVRNCTSPFKMQFEIAGLVMYIGAATVRSAFEDVKNRLGGAEGYEDTRIYLAEDALGFAPRLREGVYALMIKPSDTNSNGGDANQEHNHSRH